MRPNWLITILLFILGAVLTCAACGDDDDSSTSSGQAQDDDASPDDDEDTSPDDDDDNDDNDNDDEDDDNDDDNDGPYRPYGEGLPPCDPYVDDFAWFEIENFESKVESFADIYGMEPQLCIAAVDGGNLEVACDDWSLSLTWQKESGQFPIQDGQHVKVLANTYLDDYGDVQNHTIGILSEETDILLFQTDGMIGYWFQGAPWYMRATSSEVVCEYYADQAQPPSSPDDPFTQVVGHSLSGNLNGNYEFSLPAPQTAAPTKDDEHWAILPLYYVGVWDWSEDCCDDCDEYKFLLQLVKK